MILDFSTHADKIFSKVFNKVFYCKKRFVVVFGGAGCFAPNQNVITNKGSKPIQDIKVGDKVLTMGVNGTEYKRVEETYQYNNDKKMLRVKLKNGNVIEATEDHKFFFGGAWVELKDIVSLWHGRNI